MKTTSSPETFAQTLERTLDRLRGGAQQLVQSGTVAGTLTLASLIGISGCGEAPPPEGTTDDPNGTLGDGKADWAQEQGKRDTSKVSYQKQFWHKYTNYNGRFGYQGVDVFIKVKVQPVAGADLSKKRVGVEFRSPGGTSRTALGSFFAAQADGSEEWHVQVSLRSSDPHAFVFNTWYQDGKGNTYYDDNNGEFYAIAYDGAFSVIRQDWGGTKITVSPAGIKGNVSLVLTDLDYDKDVRIRYTTDDWKTQKEIPMGLRGQKNVVAYDSKLGWGQERWVAELDLPAAGVSRLQYAIVYKHGTINGATPQEFWDNNGGQNFVVLQTP